MKYDLLHIQGKPYVLVPLHDYREILGGPGDDVLPDEILDALAEGGESAIRILRKYRGLTQKDLAEKAGISRPYLTEIETGKKDGSLRAMRSLAAVLKVDVGLVA